MSLEMFRITILPALMLILGAIVALLGKIIWDWLSSKNSYNAEQYKYCQNQFTDIKRDVSSIQSKLDSYHSEVMAKLSNHGERIAVLESQIK